MTRSSPARLIVLDRDGVINRESSKFIRSPEEWLPLPGSIKAIADLTSAGFSVIVATNQSGVGRGLFTAEALAAIHARMIDAIESGGGRLSGIFYCPHCPEDNCECRKPRPGLMRQIENHFGTALRGQPVVGDSHRDLVAAWTVDARAILVRTGNGAITESRLGADAREVEVFPDLAAVAAALIAEHQAT